MHEPLTISGRVKTASLRTPMCTDGVFDKTPFFFVAWPRNCSRFLRERILLSPSFFFLFPSTNYEFIPIAKWPRRLYFETLFRIPRDENIYIYIYSKKDRLYYVSWFFKVEQTIYLSVENQKYSFHYLSLMHLFIDHVKISLALIYVYIYITVNDIFIYIYI